VLTAEPVLYRYRYCDRCRREWPARHAHCPDCVRWLGDAPLERTEWAIAPAPVAVERAGCYEVIAASALTLRVVGTRLVDDQLAAIQTILQGVFRHADPCRVLEVARAGWLLWSTESARQVFTATLTFRDAFVEVLPTIRHKLAAASRLRWGIAVDLLLLPCSNAGHALCVTTTAARAIFAGEPDDRLVVSAAVFEANRRWESFVAVPARLRDGGEQVAHLPIGSKRPSAFDHASVPDMSDFVDRTNELALLERAWQRSQSTSTTVTAIIAPPGAGKTRLIRQWMRSHPEANDRHANFSIFGGDLADFVSQIAVLPEGHPAADVLLSSAVMQITRDGIRALVLDDLHWADQEAWAFLRALLGRLPARGVMVVVATRPAGEAGLSQLAPQAVLRLPVVPTVDLDTLARRLSPSPQAAARATALARGNPLFVEHFAAWASETGYAGDGPCPETLHDVVMARIGHLATSTLRPLRERIMWTPEWGRAELNARFAAVEVEIGLWLDRLETGDYGDPVGLIEYLDLLRRVEFELFMAANLSGRPRPRSARLREAIDRLVLGNAATLVATMRDRAAALHGHEDRGLAEQAEWIGMAAREGGRWALARACIAIAMKAAPAWQHARLRTHLAEIERLEGEGDDGPIADPQADIVREIEACPATNPTRLPEAWYRLGRHVGCQAYYQRAMDAAKAVGAVGWERRARAAMAVVAAP
jgi:hypothetical protein